MLTAWEIWRHRNACVFDEISLRPQLVVLMILEKVRFWSLAGAARLAGLLECLPPASVVSFSSARRNLKTNI
ncbi:hypothetical protein PR202_gb10097 [Eleusine coracana subsp. coracana]|uniref:Uncharacterized protein n=1 Tax=Eleusine coracana subsp. coracana TaxID=191504 RepID=A0AAV5EIW1_ELECO|nr:hypothetical protein PR202_gb10097 [Eleusine coracana subsp. coracana]